MSNVESTQSTRSTRSTRSTKQNHDSSLISRPPSPLIQHAQKCAWCNKYLIGAEHEFTLYNGSDPLYKGWICHVKCNK